MHEVGNNPPRLIDGENAAFIREEMLKRVQSTVAWLMTFPGAFPRFEDFAGAVMTSITFDLELKGESKQYGLPTGVELVLKDGRMLKLGFDWFGSDLEIDVTEGKNSYEISGPKAIAVFSEVANRAVYFRSVLLKQGIPTEAKDANLLKLNVLSDDEAKTIASCASRVAH